MVSSSSCKNNNKNKNKNWNYFNLNLINDICKEPNLKTKSKNDSRLVTKEDKVENTEEN